MDGKAEWDHGVEMPGAREHVLIILLGGGWEEKDSGHCRSWIEFAFIQRQYRFTALKKSFVLIICH